jgi:hypothetical protein
MESFYKDEEEDESASKLLRQVVSFFLHTALALGSWLALMLAGYALNFPSIPQPIILLLSLCIPLIAGFIVTHFRRDEMATVVWLLGLTWLMIVALWVVDMPTRPSQCFQCGITEKLSRTFFSLPTPSGLIDDDGPFIATWPAAALVGYSLGAMLALRRSKHHED